MIENAIEAGAVMARLRAAVEDVDLSPVEVELLVGLAPGGWNHFASGRPLAAMTRLQETRARLAVELMRSLGGLLPTDLDVGEWMRRDNPVLDWLSPLDWSAESLDNLRALVGAIRLELHG